MSDEENIYPKSCKSEDQDGEFCYGCGDTIMDRYLLKVNGMSWHGKCLRCCVCDTILDKQTTCYTKDDNIYCKSDYIREFGAKCSKCSRNIQSSDWVRRAKSHVYHLACFACDSCKRQLSTGEEFALQDDKVLCKTHYQESMDAGSLDKSPGSADSGGKSKTKRVRTTFTDEQLQVLQANFSLDSNPDGQDLERIAQITGLSKRVTQVWFQNSRARQKKHQQGHIGARQQQQQQQQQLSLSGGSSPTGVLTSLSSMSPNMTPPHCMTPGMGNGMQQHSPTGPMPCDRCGMPYCMCGVNSVPEMTSLTDQLCVNTSA